MSNYYDSQNIISINYFKIEENEKRDIKKSLLKYGIMKKKNNKLVLNKNHNFYKDYKNNSILKENLNILNNKNY